MNSPDAVVTAAPGPPGRLGYKRLLAINAFWFGNGAHWQPIFGTLLPLGAILADRPNKDLLIGRATAAGGVFALVVPILVGWLSDRTHSRWGRRRPWMVAGSLLNVAGLMLLAVSGSPVLLVSMYLIVQATNNVAGAAYSGVIPDVVPVEERGRASGLLGMMNGIGTVVGFAGIFAASAVFGDSRETLIYGYAYISVVLVVTLVITCLGTPEVPRVRSGPRQKVALSPLAMTFAAVFLVFVASFVVALGFGIGDTVLIAIVVLSGLASLLLGAYLPPLRAFLRPFKNHDFFWVFATRFLTQIGIFAIVPFIQLYFLDVVGAGDKSSSETSLWLLCVIGSGIPFAVVAGAVSDRLKRRKIFVYASGGTMAFATAAIILGLITSLPILYGIGVIFGIGYGIYYGVDWALACDVLPSGGEEAGKDMALWHVSLTLPQVLATALLAPVLHYFNESGHIFVGVGTGNNLGYRVVFGFAALWFLLGTVMVSRIRAVR